MFLSQSPGCVPVASRPCPWQEGQHGSSSYSLHCSYKRLRNTQEEICHWQMHLPNACSHRGGPGWGSTGHLCRKKKQTAASRHHCCFPGSAPPRGGTPEKHVGVSPPRSNTHPVTNSSIWKKKQKWNQQQQQTKERNSRNQIGWNTCNMCLNLFQILWFFFFTSKYWP